MKLYRLLDWLTAVGIALSLILNIINIYKLLSTRNLFYSLAAIFLIAIELLAGYAFFNQMRRRWKNRDVLKSRLAQDAIALLCEHPEYNLQRATNLILSVCRDFSAQNYEPMLRSIAARAIMARQLRGKIFIGDISCKYNARSPYLRCAIAPTRESCQGCSDYSKLNT